MKFKKILKQTALIFLILQQPAQTKAIHPAVAAVAAKALATVATNKLLAQMVIKFIYDVAHNKDPLKDDSLLAACILGVEIAFPDIGIIKIVGEQYTDLATIAQKVFIDLPLPDAIKAYLQEAVSQALQGNMLMLADIMRLDSAFVESATEQAQVSTQTPYANNNISEQEHTIVPFPLNTHALSLIDKLSKDVKGFNFNAQEFMNYQPASLADFINHAFLTKHINKLAEHAQTTKIVQEQAVALHACVRLLNVFKCSQSGIPITDIKSTVEKIMASKQSAINTFITSFIIRVLKNAASPVLNLKNIVEHMHRIVIKHASLGKIVSEVYSFDINSPQGRLMLSDEFRVALEEIEQAFPEATSAEIAEFAGNLIADMANGSPEQLLLSLGKDFYTHCKTNNKIESLNQEPEFDDVPDFHKQFSARYTPLHYMTGGTIPVPNPATVAHIASAIFSTFSQYIKEKFSRGPQQPEVASDKPSDQTNTKVEEKQIPITKNKQTPIDPAIDPFEGQRPKVQDSAQSKPVQQPQATPSENNPRKEFEAQKKKLFDQSFGDMMGRIRNARQNSQEHLAFQRQLQHARSAYIQQNPHVTDAIHKRIEERITHEIADFIKDPSVKNLMNLYDSMLFKPEELDWFKAEYEEKYQELKDYIIDLHISRSMIFDSFEMKPLYDHEQHYTAQVLYDFCFHNKNRGSIYSFFEKNNPALYRKMKMHGPASHPMLGQMNLQNSGAKLYEYQTFKRLHRLHQLCKAGVFHEARIRADKSNFLDVSLLRSHNACSAEWPHDIPSLYPDIDKTKPSEEPTPTCPPDNTPTADNDCNTDQPNIPQIPEQDPCIPQNKPSDENSQDTACNDSKIKGTGGISPEDAQAPTPQPNPDPNEDPVEPEHDKENATEPSESPNKDNTSIDTSNTDVIKEIEGILRDTKSGRKTKGSSKLYEKEGGLKEALLDFEKLNPSNIKDFNKVKTGNLSNGWKINVRIESTDTRPTLEIQKDSSKKIKIRYGSKKD